MSESRMTRQELGEEAVWLHEGGLHPELVIKALDRHGNSIARALAYIGRRDLMRFYTNRDRNGRVRDFGADDDGE